MAKSHNRHIKQTTESKTAKKLNKKTKIQKPKNTVTPNLKQLNVQKNRQTNSGTDQHFEHIDVLKILADQH